jgi:hypothetical protein
VTAKWIRPRPSTASQSSGRGRQVEELECSLEEEEDARVPAECCSEAAPEELQNGKGKTRILMSPGATPRSAPEPKFGVGFAVCVCNDPSAGSPTETLLRLLLPLNDKV